MTELILYMNNYSIIEVIIAYQTYCNVHHIKSTSQRTKCPYGRGRLEETKIELRTFNSDTMLN